MYVKEALHRDEVLSMNHINEMYVDALVEKGTETDGNTRTNYKIKLRTAEVDNDVEINKPKNYKKHLKSLLSKNIPGIEFRQPLCRNQSATVFLKSSVTQMVDSLVKSNVESPAMFSLCKILRYEVLQFRDWQFTGDFSSWKNPPVLEYVLRQIMFGPNHVKLTGLRKDDAQACVDVVCQSVCKNSKSDRQVNLKSQVV